MTAAELCVGQCRMPS